MPHSSLAFDIAVFHINRTVLAHVCARVRALCVEPCATVIESRVAACIQIGYNSRLLSVLHNPSGIQEIPRKSSVPWHTKAVHMLLACV